MVCSCFDGVSTCYQEDKFKLNWYGTLSGCFLVIVFYFLHRLIDERSTRKCILHAESKINVEEA